MKVVCSKSNLISGLQIVSKAVPSKTTMSILECILVDATEGVIKFIANDMELGIQTIVEGNIEERGYIDKCIKFEETKGQDYLYNAVGKLLRLTNDDNLMVNHIVKNTPDKSVVFLTGVGKAFPFVRSHNVLNNLHQVLDKVPVVMFYPGRWNGQTLELFGTINDGNYYRALPLVD